MMLIAVLTWAPAAAPFYADRQNLLAYDDGSGVLRPVTTTAEWERRRAQVLEGMQEAMGPLPPESNKGPLDMRVVEETDCGSYVRKRITLAVESWDRLPAFLLIPKRIEGKTAGIVCPHPTNADGKDMVVGLCPRENRNSAQELAERGYVVIAPDYPGFGEYVECRKALYEHGYVSATMKGIWNHMRCVDLLQGLPEVDPERIGCIGHSLGGHNTLFLGAFDPRVKVMVSSCGFNRFAKYYGGDLTGWTHDGYMPRIATEYGKDPAKMPFDFTEILGILAPRPVFVNAPLRDANFEVSGVDDCIRAAKPVYALYGAADRLVAVHPDCEHDFPPEAREQAYAFMDAALKPK